MWSLGRFISLGKFPSLGGYCDCIQEKDSVPNLSKRVAQLPRWNGGSIEMGQSHSQVTELRGIPANLASGTESSIVPILSLEIGGHLRRAGNGARACHAAHGGGILLGRRQRNECHLLFGKRNGRALEIAVRCIREPEPSQG